MPSPVPNGRLLLFSYSNFRYGKFESIVIWWYNAGSEGKRKWIRPRKLEYKEWGLWIQPEEGLFIGCANVRVIPKFEITYSSKGICLVPMTIKFQSELEADEGMEDPTKAS